VRTEVTTRYLQMLGADQLRTLPVPDADVQVMAAAIASPELNRFLYTAVGGPWFWTGRLGWDYARWLAYLERPEIETLVLYVSGTPAGYVETEVHADGGVELVQFGLLPRFIGRRLGGYFLGTGVARAWARGAKRIWLHTCTLDGPHALANYRARGFVEYDRKTEFWDLPDATPGPWPNAGPTM
jgi:ribosomal protein S18 acetylase RimI-like enzyme